MRSRSTPNTSTVSATDCGVSAHTASSARTPGSTCAARCGALIICRSSALCDVASTGTSAKDVARQRRHQPQMVRVHHLRAKARAHVLHHPPRRGEVLLDLHRRHGGEDRRLVRHHVAVAGQRERRVRRREHDRGHLVRRAGPAPPPTSRAGRRRSRAARSRGDAASRTIAARNTPLPERPGRCERMWSSRISAAARPGCCGT